MLAIMLGVISIVNIPLIAMHFSPEILKNHEEYIKLVCNCLTIITQMVISIIMESQHKAPAFSLEKFTLKLKGLPKFKDEIFLNKKKLITKIFIESHIRNLSDKIEVIDINFGPRSTARMDEIAEMQKFQQQHLKMILGYIGSDIAKAQSIFEEYCS